MKAEVADRACRSKAQSSWPLEKEVTSVHRLEGGAGFGVDTAPDSAVESGPTLSLVALVALIWDTLVVYSQVVSDTLMVQGSPSEVRGPLVVVH